MAKFLAAGRLFARAGTKEGDGEDELGRAMSEKATTRKKQDTAPSSPSTRSQPLGNLRREASPRQESEAPSPQASPTSQHKNSFGRFLSNGRSKKQEDMSPKGSRGSMESHKVRSRAMSKVSFAPPTIVNVELQEGTESASISPAAVARLEASEDDQRKPEGAEAPDSDGGDDDDDEGGNDGGGDGGGAGGGNGGGDGDEREKDDAAGADRENREGAGNDEGVAGAGEAAEEAPAEDDAVIVPVNSGRADGDEADPAAPPRRDSARSTQSTFSSKRSVAVEDETAAQGEGGPQSLRLWAEPSTVVEFSAPAVSPALSEPIARRVPSEEVLRRALSLASTAVRRDATATPAPGATNAVALARRQYARLAQEAVLGAGAGGSAASSPASRGRDHFSTELFDASGSPRSPTALAAGQALLPFFEQDPEFVWGQRQERMPVTLRLQGFRREGINGDYAPSRKPGDTIGGLEVYEHISGKFLLYFNRKLRHWSVTNSRANAAKRIALVHAPAKLDIRDAWAGEGWREWDRASGKWVTAKAGGVVAIEVSSDLVLTLPPEIFSGTSPCVGDGDSFGRGHEEVAEVCAAALRGAVLSVLNKDFELEEDDVDVVVDPDTGRCLARIDLPTGVSTEQLHAALAEARAQLAGDVVEQVSTGLPGVNLPDAVDLAGQLAESLEVGHRPDCVLSLVHDRGGLMVRRGADDLGVCARSPSEGPSQHRRQHHSGCWRFRQHLLTKAPSFVAAWRTLLDPNTTGFVTRNEFIECCKRIHFRDNVRAAWQELDSDGAGRLTLLELDWMASGKLMEFYTLLQCRFGSISAACAKLKLVGVRRMDRNEFVAQLTAHAISRKTVAEELFFMLADFPIGHVCSKGFAQGSLTKSSFEWLEKMSPMLARPALGRVQPGTLCLGMDEGVDYDPSEGSLSDSGTTATVDNAPNYGGVHTEVFSDSEYESWSRRLYRQGEEWHTRRNERTAAALSPTPRRPRRARGPYNLEHIEHLHQDHHRRELARAAKLAADNLVPPSPRRRLDDQIQKRLLSPRVPKKPPKFEWDEVVSERHKRARSEEPQICDKACMRLYAEYDARMKRHQSKKELAEKKVGELMANAQSTRKGALKDVNRRMFYQQVAVVEKRRENQELEKRDRYHRELAALCNPQTLTSVNNHLEHPRPVYDAKTDAAHRLHADAFRREQDRRAASAERAAKEIAELEESSVHRFADVQHNGIVHERLYKSYNRYIGPDGIDRSLPSSYAFASDSALHVEHADYWPEDDWEPQAEPGFPAPIYAKETHAKEIREIGREPHSLHSPKGRDGHRPSNAFRGVKNLCRPRTWDQEAQPPEAVFAPDMATLGEDRTNVLKRSREERARKAKEEAMAAKANKGRAEPSPEVSPMNEARHKHLDVVKGSDGQMSRSLSNLSQGRDGPAMRRNSSESFVGKATRVSLAANDVELATGGGSRRGTMLSNAPRMGMVSTSSLTKRSSVAMLRRSVAFSTTGDDR